MNIHSLSESSTADGLSVLPVAQQVVGLGTIIAAIIKIWKEHQKIQDFEMRLQTPSNNPSTGRRKQQRVSKEIPEAKERIKKYEDEILLGLIRLTPVVGTIYSIYKWQKSM